MGQHLQGPESRFIPFSFGPGSEACTSLSEFSLSHVDQSKKFSKEEDEEFGGLLQDFG